MPSEKELKEILDNDPCCLRDCDEQSYFDEFVGDNLVGE